MTLHYLVWVFLKGFKNFKQIETKKKLQKNAKFKTLYLCVKTVR